jgi:putative thioredoxin
MSDQFSANLRGAVDLSALRQPSTASAGTTAAANPGAATPQSGEPIAVASLISAMTETNLRYFLELSSKVVVLVDFYSTADESSVALSAKLESLIDGFAGKVVLCRVDVAEQPRVAEAFGVTAPATLLAMMAGQPVPLFSGDQQLEKIQEIFEKLLVVAANNSVTGSVVVDANVEPVASTPQLPPKHKAAVELLNAGSYAEAKSHYQQILNETPSDPIAAAVAQCELLLRLEGVDVDKVLNAPPQNFADLLVAADALLAIGDYSDAFEALLVNFAEAVQENKNLMRERLLQYFEIVGKSTPEVVAARNRLTSMLF